LGVVVRQRVTDHLGANRLRPESELKQSARHLAGTEARDAHLFLQPAKGFVDCFSELILVDFDGELDTIALEYFGSGTHRSCVLYRASANPPDIHSQRPTTSLSGCLYDHHVAVRGDGT
jgi:hypothetical protein